MMCAQLCQEHPGQTSQAIPLSWDHRSDHRVVVKGLGEEPGHYGKVFLLPLDNGDAHAVPLRQSLIWDVADPPFPELGEPSCSGYQFH